MPRVHQVKAAKDYPDQGIAKGDMYYKWSFRYGGEHRSKTPPRPSQLTQSKMSAAYAAMEDLEDNLAAQDSPSAIADLVRDAANNIREVAQEYQDGFDALPENLQQGGQAQESQEKATTLNDFADEMDTAADVIESLDASEYVDEEARREAAKVEADEAGTKVDEDLLQREIDVINTFEELTPEEQEQMLDAARDLANELSLPI